MVRVEVMPTFENFWRFNRAVIVRRLGLPLAIVVFGPLLAFGWLYLANPQELTPASAAYLIVPAFVLLVVPFSLRRTVRKQWNSSPTLRELRTYELGERGIRYEGHTFRGEFDWSLVRQVRLIDGLIALAITSNTYHVLPLSAVPPDQRGELEDLFRANVPGFTGL